MFKGVTIDPCLNFRWNQENLDSMILRVESPQLVDPVNLDARPRSDSDAINAGIGRDSPGVPYYEYDFYGNLKDSQPDIGAVKYQG